MNVVQTPRAIPNKGAFVFLLLPRAVFLPFSFFQLVIICILPICVFHFSFDERYHALFTTVVVFSIRMYKCLMIEYFLF